jgi:hypothetical protein
MNETNLPELIEAANGFASAVLELAALHMPEPRDPAALAVLVAGAELARWRLLDGDTPAAEHARALAVDVFESAATNEIAAIDLDSIEELLAEWAAYDEQAGITTPNHENHAL